MNKFTHFLVKVSKFENLLKQLSKFAHKFEYNFIKKLILLRFWVKTLRNFMQCNATVQYNF